MPGSMDNDVADFLDEDLDEQNSPPSKPKKAKPPPPASPAPPGASTPPVSAAQPELKAQKTCVNYGGRKI